MAKGNHSFTEQDIRKRFGAIVGHTVAEVDTAGVLTASAAPRNKGRIGAVIEQSVLGYPADSDRRPDIVIDGQPWEVKATGLKESAHGGWCAKEPMSITAVAPEGIVTESFSTSAFWHKVERLLVVYYLYVRPGRGVAVEYAGFEFKGYDLHTWREVDRCRLEADWTTVQALNLLLFVLSAENGAEIVYTPPKTPRGQKVGRRTNTETVRMLGAKIGSAIGAARRVRYAPHHGTGERTVAPHVRRVHWQSFWTGKRKGRKDGKFGDELVVKWIPPIPVNQGAGEVTETVHLNSTEAGE